MQIEESVKKQEPAIVLKGRSGSDHTGDCPIYWTDIADAKVGDSWMASVNCERDAVRESAVVVYYDDEATVLLVTAEYCEDSLRGEYSAEKRLVAFQF